MLTTSTIRKNNMLEVFRVIKRKRIVSRPEIAQQTNLTNVTVRKIIGELMKSNIVMEEGYAKSYGGRKALLYRLNKNACFIIGINMKINSITIDLFDLEATKVFKGNPVCLKDSQSVENTIWTLLRSIHRLIKDTAEKYHHIIGIGVTLPGRIDHEKGLVSHLTHLDNWVNIPLRDIIEAETGIPTCIERDTNSHISYLKWLDITENRPNVVYCSIGEGIGSAVMIEGSVYHGDHGLAGELGHTTLNPDGPKCSCGNYGCVELYTSNKAILNYYRENLPESGNRISDILGLLQSGNDEADIIDILAKQALGGDADADRAFAKASGYIGCYIVNIINSYNPSLIILECRWMRIVGRLFDEILRKIFESTALINMNDVKIILNPVEDIFSFASSTIVLEQLFSKVKNNRLIG